MDRNNPSRLERGVIKTAKTLILVAVILPALGANYFIEKGMNYFNKLTEVKGNVRKTEDYSTNQPLNNITNSVYR